MEDEVLLPVSRDSPAMVVKIHVVERTQQDAAVDVGAAALCIRIDVMRLAIRCGAVARGDAASAIPNRECDALLGGEEPRLSSEIERIARRIEGDGHGGGVAGSGADDPAGQRRADAAIRRDSPARTSAVALRITDSRSSSSSPCAVAGMPAASPSPNAARSASSAACRSEKMSMIDCVENLRHSNKGTHPASVMTLAPALCRRNQGRGRRPLTSEPRPPQIRPHSSARMTMEVAVGFRSGGIPGRERVWMPRSRPPSP